MFRVKPVQILKRWTREVIARFPGNHRQEVSEASPARPATVLRQLDFMRMFLRSFFIQSLWNYRCLQSVGFCIALFPIARRLYKTPEERRGFLLRHLKFFNAHPYMASYALGVCARLEEAHACGDPQALKKLDRVKELLISILGAVGDHLFWFVIKPFSLIMGVLLITLVDSELYKALALGATFLMYNIPHFYLRYKGLKEGYRYGLEIYRCFTGERFQGLERIYLYGGIVAFLLFLAILIRTMITVGLLNILVWSLAAVSAFIVYRFTQSLYMAVFLSLLIGLVAGIFH